MRKQSAILAAALVLSAALPACEWSPRGGGIPQEEAQAARDAVLFGHVSPRAHRVFYRDENSLEWGTVCALEQGGYLSVEHVTANGTPKIGPTDPVTASDGASDWSFLGVHPDKLDAEDFPALADGMIVEIHGFPARDRDGEIIPAEVYSRHTVPPFVWLELKDSAAGVEAEGVIGGISGSCVLDKKTGDLVAVVHANGFSRIEGTTNTWALVVPARSAVLEAQGEPVAAALALFGKPVPTASEMKAGGL